MPAINFPIPLETGETFTANNLTWQWDGLVWQSISSAQLGYTGSIGYTGSAGAGYTGSAGYAGSVGYTGSSGYTGSKGDQGSAGVSNSIFNYRANTTVYSGYPTDGMLSWNNSTQTSATTIMVSHLTDNNIDIDIYLALLQNTQKFVIQDASNSSNYQNWQINGTPYVTNGGTATSYWTIPVTLISSSGTGTSGFAFGPLFLGVVTGAKGDSGYVGSVGYTGSSGSVGYTGSKGDRGADGSFGGAAFKYKFSNDITDSNPGNGYLKFNNATISSANRLRIDYEDINLVSVYSFLQTIDDSTSAIKGHFSVSDKNNTSNYALFAITTSHTEHVDHFDIPVSYLSGSISLTDQTEVIITFARTGDIGDRGPIGYVGSVGYSGSQGVGYAGSAGYSGSVGYVGSIGDKGYTGSRGAGYTGSQGETGYIGSKGDKGEQGISIRILGSVATSADLPVDFNSPGDGWVTLNDSHVWVWNYDVAPEWTDLGQISGPKGDIGYSGSSGYTGSASEFPGYAGSVGYTGSASTIVGYTGSASTAVGYTGSKGDVGPQGVSISLKGSVNTFGDLPSTGNSPNDAYIVIADEDLYVWNGTIWSNVGQIIGFTGSKGNVGYTGSRGEVGFTGSKGDIGYSGSVGYVGSIGYTGSQGYIGSAGKAIINPTPPSDVPMGTLWYNSNRGTLKIYYVGSSSAAWIDVVGGPQGRAGYVGSAGNNDVPQNAQTSSYTLVASDASKHISITTGGVTVPANIFTIGNTITIFNNSSVSQSIIQGSGVTMYLVAVGYTGNRLLSGRGLATLLCVATNTFVITGGGLS